MAKIAKITLCVENANFATAATIEGLVDAIKAKDKDAEVIANFDLVEDDC